MQFNKIYIPYVGRDKYEDNRKVIARESTGGSSGGGGVAGGVGTTEYMTAWETGSGDTAGQWTLSGLTSITSLSNGTAILVKFNKPSISGASNTIDVGFGSDGESGNTFPKPVYLYSGTPVTNEIKEGDEYWLTYRDYLSGWTIDASNERYAREIWEKKTITDLLENETTMVMTPYTAAASGDVLAYGAAEYSGWTELNVIDNLSGGTGNHTNNALSAYQGKVLNDRLEYLEASAITQIKTINGISLIGPGNVEIEGGSGGSASTFVVGSGLTFDNETQEYRVADYVFQAIDSKYDKTGGYISGTVEVSGDVICYGASSAMPNELTVYDNLTTTSTTDALSANMGKYLNDHKQETLVSGTNIKTINGESLLGEGDIVISGGSGGGGMEYTAGSGISISNSAISVSNALFEEIYSKIGSGDTVRHSFSADTANSANTSTYAQYLGDENSNYSKTTLDNALNDKYDKTGGTINGSVYATGTISADGDIMTYGASSAVPNELSVIDNLNSNSSTDALSAKQGKVLSGLINTKQDILVSGVNIKTINGSAITGSGNIVIEGGGGGSTYFAGTNISITDNVISVSGRVESATTSLSAETAVSATTSLSATTTKSASSATYASYLGDANSNYSKSTLDNALGEKYDVTGGTVNGNVEASGFVSARQDIMCYGASQVMPNPEIVVIQDLIHSANTTVNVLAARQGYLLDQNKQDKLISGTNIKTINNQSILGSGNITIEGGGGEGTVYYAGENIEISTAHVISVSGSVKSAQTCQNADKLGGTAASGYAQTGGTYNSMTVGTAGTSTYAERIGTSSAYYTKSSLDTAFNGKLGTGGTAYDSNRLGGTAASGYLKTGDTAADSNKLGGTEASGYLKTGATAADSNKLGGVAASGYLTTGGTAADSNKLGGTAASGYLKTGDTATNSTKWGGYNIVVGSTGTSSNTIYFGY